MKKVVVATGGTGGHLFPALKVAERLREQDREVSFCGSFRVGKEILQKRRFDVFEYHAEGLVFRPIWRVLRSTRLMGKAVQRSKHYLKDIRPDVVCGFGGYGSFPSVVAARLLGIPTMVHEQNVKPGRANLLCSRFAARIAINFEKSQKYFPAHKTVATGCPSNIGTEELSVSEARQALNLEKNRFTILVMGGSQGSDCINKIFTESLAKLNEHFAFQVIHLCGKNNDEPLKKLYNEKNIPSVVFPFTEDMALVYSAADLVVSRAGALTVTEIAGYHLPAILIPYPFAYADHQTENALLLAEAQMASILVEDILDVDGLVETIVQWHVRRRDDDFQQNQKDIFIPNAVDRIIHEMEDLCA